MTFRRRYPRLLALAAAGALAGCATTAPRLHTAEELGAVAHRCGFALGEVIQEAEEPRLLFLFAAEATETEVRCVQRWSRRRHLHFVHIEAVVDAAE